MIARPFLRQISTSCTAAFVTVPSMEVAKKLAKGLVEQKLAACVNILPGITSVYECEGKIKEESELLLMIKTRSERVPQIIELVSDKNMHPYDVPEVIALPIEQGLPKYLDWIRANTKPKVVVPVTEDAAPTLAPVCVAPVSEASKQL